MVDGLNEFSRRIADVVFSRYPEWREHAEAKSASGESGFLEITMPNPAGSNLGAPASYSSYGGEVTVALDAWHGHFSPDHGPTWLDDSLDTFNDLLAEKLCVASFWSGRACRGAELIDSGAVASKRSYHADVNRLTTRSWRGTYDQDREV
jgi:hypothetical protein